MNGANQDEEENKLLASATSNENGEDMLLNLPHHYLAEADFEIYDDLPKPTKNVVSDSAWSQTHSFQIHFPILIRSWPRQGRPPQISILTLDRCPKLYEPIC